MRNSFKDRLTDRWHIAFMALTLWIAVSVIPAALTGTPIATGGLGQVALKEFIRLLCAFAFIVVLSYVHGMGKTQNAFRAALVGGILSGAGVIAALVFEWRAAAPSSAYVYSAFVFVAAIAWSVFVYDATRRNSARGYAR